jgi:hypothetical protein
LERRTFLAGLPAAAVMLPTVALANHKVTRLVAGGNPIAGFSHSTLRLSQLMLQYFTVGRTIEFILNARPRAAA